MTDAHDWNRAFGATVVLRITTPKKATFAVRSTREMAFFLLDQWSGPKSENYTAACHACHEAIKGTATPASARLALIEAARDAGILEDTVPFHPTAVEKVRPAA